MKPLPISFRVKKVQKRASDEVKTALAATAGRLMPVQKSPDEAYRQLFTDVQQRQVYKDGKTFVDMVPRVPPREILRRYRRERKESGFTLDGFVNKYFYHYDATSHRVLTEHDHSARDYVRSLWPSLERRNRKNRGSLISVPYTYVVPGGRFTEQFYWDSYFIMIGLAADDKWTLVYDMIRNYSYMMQRFKLIPTANRTYFLSRSQPPFFADMVSLLARHHGKASMAEFLPTMLAEYRFWMKGAKRVVSDSSVQAYLRVVKMPDGTLLNRYFDNKNTPRPESRREDVITAEQARNENKDKIFLDLRAGAESGWDFSSRWFDDPHDIESIHTTDIVPIDLNCLLYNLEVTIAETYRMLKQSALRRRFLQAAEDRKAAIQRYLWNDPQHFFFDYDFRRGYQTKSVTLAGVFPLYDGVATAEQAASVAKRIETDFLKKGGLVTTLETSGQQWDAPNGWAPLQWVAVRGLQRYGLDELAATIRDRWLVSNEQVFAKYHKMIEKYNVTTPGEVGGGGEYELQDGFGWTNGVYAVFKDEQQAELHGK